MTEVELPNRSEKFSERARRALTSAQEEARDHNHSYIGTEHILLGLICEEGGMAIKILTYLGTSPDKIHSAVEFIIGHGKESSIGKVGLTPRAKRVIELAIDEARHLGHNYIGTEHLLLGLMHEGEGVAASVLDSFGITLEQTRAETTHILSQAGVRSRLTCQKCQEPLKPEWYFCPGCGAPTLFFCKACQKPLEDKFGFCPSCGQKVDKEELEREEEEEREE